MLSPLRGFLGSRKHQPPAAQAATCLHGFAAIKSSSEFACVCAVVVAIEQPLSLLHAFEAIRTVTGRITTRLGIRDVRSLSTAP